MPQALVKTTMQAAFAAALGRLPPQPLYETVHRWRYALTETPLGAPFLSAWDGRLLIGGDWALGPGAEDAWSSGRAMAEAIALALPSAARQARDAAWPDAFRHSTTSRTTGSTR